MNLKFFQKLEKFISYTIQLTGFAITLKERRTPVRLFCHLTLKPVWRPAFLKYNFLHLYLKFYEFQVEQFGELSELFCDIAVTEDIMMLETAVHQFFNKFSSRTFEPHC
jgi:hypothetical protein